MNQTTLVDDRFAAVTDGGVAVPQDDRSPIADHPATSDVDIAGMDLENGREGWRDFPHPDDIYAHVDEDVWTEQSVLPDEVSEAIDSLTDSPEVTEFAVMDAEAVYKYLESLQKKSDLHFQNFERRQLRVDCRSNGRRNGRKTMLSHYDKMRICEWEVRRRLSLSSMDKWKTSRLSKSNKGLPNTDD
jgi:hypothetical protein